jgi:hypothetical protein
MEDYKFVKFFKMNVKLIKAVLSYCQICNQAAIWVNKKQLNWTQFQAK